MQVDGTFPESSTSIFRNLKSLPDVQHPSLPQMYKEQSFKGVFLC